jgi:ketosteroid isomerase-like protein
MNYKIIALSIMAFCLSSLAGMASAQKAVKTNDDVLRVLNEYDNAWNKKDVGGVAKILAADYVYFNSLGGTSVRQQTLDFLSSPEYKLTFVERSEIKSYRTGDTVVVSSRWKGKGSWSKGEINDDQRCGLIFVKDGKKWKLVSENCAQIVSK